MTSPQQPYKPKLSMVIAICFLAFLCGAGGAATAMLLNGVAPEIKSSAKTDFLLASAKAADGGDSGASTGTSVGSSDAAVGPTSSGSGGQYTSIRDSIPGTPSIGPSPEQVAQNAEAITNSINANTAAVVAAIGSATKAVESSSQAIITAMGQQTDAANIRESHKRKIDPSAAAVAQSIADVNTAKTGLRTAAKASANKIAIDAAQYCLKPVPAATRTACFAKLSADMKAGGFVPSAATGDNSDHSYSLFSKAYAQTGGGAQNADLQSIGCSNFAGPVELNDTKPKPATSLAQAQGQACLFAMLLKVVAMYNPIDQAQADPNKSANAPLLFQAAASKAVQAILPMASALANNMIIKSPGNSVFAAHQQASEQFMKVGQTAGVVSDAQQGAGEINVAEANTAVADARSGEGNRSLPTKLAGANGVDGADVINGVIAGSATSSSGETTVVSSSDDGSGMGSGSSQFGELYVPPKTLVSGLSLKDIFVAAPPETTLLSQNSP